MPQAYVTSQGTLIVPGGYPAYQVRNSASGLSTSGVLMLVGEADGGPDYTQETDLSANFFGPGQAADVIQKYQSGPLVDAYRAAVAPMNDTEIQGSPSRLIIVKVNPSTKASAALTMWGGGAYGTLYDHNYGKLGNLIYFNIAANTSEVVPTTGAFTWLENINALNLSVRVNGGAEQTTSLSALTTPAALVIALNLLTGITASGGADRLTIQAVAGTLAVGSISGNTATFTISTSWAVTPSAGDLLFVSGTSVVKGPSNENAGSWVVVSATATTIIATKLCDAAGTNGQLTSPTAVGATPIASTTNDLRCFAPVTVANTAGNPINGIGKTLEINELTTGSDRLSNYAYQLNTVKVTWVSKSTAVALLSSSSEYQPILTEARQFDNVLNTVTAGGEVVLTLGYKGTTASIVLGNPGSDNRPTTAVITRTGGAGADIGTLTLSQFPTLNDLVAYINAQTGYTAAVGTATLGQLPSSALDVGTYTFGSTFGAKTGRLKADAYRWYAKMATTAVLTQFSDPTKAAQAGVPQPQPSSGFTFLGGAVRGASTNTFISNAFDACKRLRGNFLCPLYSADASTDITNGLTDSTSTYTVDAINALAKSHALAMSTLKARRNRQAFLSKSDTYPNQKTAAAGLASFRCAMTFQDVKVFSLRPDGSSNIFQFQPWMGGVLAAAGQAAGFYKPLVHKTPNLSGFLHNAGANAPNGFDDQDQDKLEDALISGLLPLTKDDQGVPFWVSDQTTYVKDSNFVFNSIQAVYVADTVALTTAQRMEASFVGQSIADVSAAVAVAAMQSIFKDFVRLKLLSPSDDAPLGYKDLVIRISGPAMVVSAEIKVAGAIYFVPINFLVTQVTQSASSAGV